MEGEAGDSTKQDVKPDLGETPRRPCGLCGDFHDEDSETPKKIDKKVALIEELQELRRAQFALKRKKRLLKARLVIAQEEEREEMKEKTKMGIRAFLSMEEALNFMAGLAAKK